MSQSKKVLVVDDEQPILDLFTRALEKRGHQADVAENGRIGFRKATTEDYDLIICDLHMPEWNGVDSIKGILLVKPQCRFLVVSGYAQNVVADELRSMKEVVAILAKPAELKEILRYVEAS